MKAIGNLFWFLLGGIFMGLIWWIAGFFAYLSILGIPWGRSCFVMGQFSFFPFGKEAVSRKELTGEKDIGTGFLGLLGNLIWFVFAGFWLALGHLFFALLNFITVIGIPFGVQHLKLAGVALFPVGKKIVSKELAQAARTSNVEAELKAMRGGK
ncbi:YccF domain-containing protein [Marinospirillum insulare]|uniref:Inner membrane protein YccF n=1 Tax=Marinospirillum insulare TaxID=217169 RepID=A0ABQ5ZXW5_9GAMM|nr:YccF domain-containing protein [Marinospirillum insulare]GLR62780.1 hypothetical protein GCM10007878_02150 [Marinospirillum insulare]